MKGGLHKSGDSEELQTFVSVYLENGRDESFNVVCDAVSEMGIGSIWQRALDALSRPTPRGPYPVAGQFKIVVYEMVARETAQRDLKTYYIDVSCSGFWAHALVRVAEAERSLSRTAYLIGDDVVTVARHILASAVCAWPKSVP